LVFHSRYGDPATPAFIQLLFRSAPRRWSGTLRKDIRQDGRRKVDSRAAGRHTPRAFNVMDFDRRALQRSVAALAAQGVLMGTSSWKYPGWRGQLYDEARYVYRGKYSAARFERLCLSEYAEVFKTVSVDAAYYQFPTGKYLEELTGQVTPDFRFTFKVTDEITIRKFPNLPRFGRRAGQANPNFLNPDRFATAFLKPCEPFREQVGMLVFEFSKFYPADFVRGRDFSEALDRFLGALPGGWDYGVEMRNRNFLVPDYLAMLARHGVTHVFNSWDDMPPVEEQMALPGSRTTPDRVAARFLLRPGRKYEEAVRLFQPYDRLHEVNESGRSAGARLILEALTSAGVKRAFLYVNNRFEGNALQTLVAMLAQAAAS